MQKVGKVINKFHPKCQTIQFSLIDNKKYFSSHFLLPNAKDVVDDDEIEGQFSDGERRKFFLLIE